MDVVQASKAVSRLYPRIYFACHRRHVRDPGSNRVLSSHQVGILDHLDERAVTFISTLAEHMGVTVSTISLALDRLVHEGFVRRVPDKADRRRVGVLLTKAGVRIRDSSGASGSRSRLGSRWKTQRGRTRASSSGPQAARGCGGPRRHCRCGQTGPAGRRNQKNKAARHRRTATHKE